MSSRSRTNSTRVSQIMPLYRFVPVWLLSSRWSRNLAKIVSQQKLFLNKIVKLCEIIPDNFILSFDSMTGNLDRTNPTDWKSKCRTCRFSYWFCYYALGWGVRGQLRWVWSPEMSLVESVIFNPIWAYWACFAQGGTPRHPFFNITTLS